VRCAEELGAENKFVVCYVGTMGMAHGLETLLDAAAINSRLRIPPSCSCSSAKARRKRASRRWRNPEDLANIRFLDQQPREKIPAFISASDACAVLLRKTEVFKTVIPTKMLEFMSCSRPVILGVDGQARKIVEEAEAGIVIEPENSIALVEAIQRLAATAIFANRWERRAGNTSCAIFRAAKRPTPTFTSWMRCARPRVRKNPAPKRRHNADQNLPEIYDTGRYGCTA
jgi:glycosyltransferase involved in cell wall biosynthesis